MPCISVERNYHYYEKINILIAITLVLVFPACSSKPSNSASQDTEPPVFTVASETASSIENNLEILEKSGETSDSSASSETEVSLENDPEEVEEQVLYDKDGIVIKVTDFGSTLNLDSDLIVGEGTWLNFSVENNSKMDIEVSSILTSVNDYMVEQMYFDVFLNAGQRSDEDYSGPEIIENLKGTINIHPYEAIETILASQDVELSASN